MRESKAQPLSYALSLARKHGLPFDRRVRVAHSLSACLRRYAQSNYLFLWPTISADIERRSSRVRFFSIAAVSSEMCGISQRCSATKQIGFSVLIQLRSSNRARFSGLSEGALSPTNSRRGQGPVNRKSGPRRRRQMTILLSRYASPLRSAAPINSNRPALWDQGRRHTLNS